MSDQDRRIVEAIMAEADDRHMVDPETGAEVGAGSGIPVTPAELKSLLAGESIVVGATRRVVTLADGPFSIAGQPVERQADWNTLGPEPKGWEVGKKYDRVEENGEDGSYYSRYYALERWFYREPGTGGVYAVEYPVRVETRRTGWPRVAGGVVTPQRTSRVVQYGQYVANPDVRGGPGWHYSGRYPPEFRSPETDKVLPGRPMKATFNKDIGCTASCMNAKGSDCECSCGGANHGVSHVVSRVYTERGGKGSGHFHHKGRPGEVGGSIPSGGAAQPAADEADTSVADQLVTKEMAAEWLRVNAEDFSDEERERMAILLSQWKISMRTLYSCRGGFVHDPPVGYRVEASGLMYEYQAAAAQADESSVGLAFYTQGVYSQPSSTIHIPDRLAQDQSWTFMHVLCHECGHLVTSEFWGAGGSEERFSRMQVVHRLMDGDQRRAFYEQTGLRDYSFERYREFQADSFKVSRLGTEPQRQAVDRLWSGMEEGVPSTWRTEPEPMVTVWEPIEHQMGDYFALEFVKTQVPQSLAESCPLYLRQDPYQGLQAAPATPQEFHAGGSEAGTGTEQQVHAGGEGE